LVAPPQNTEDHKKPTRPQKPYTNITLNRKTVQRYTTSYREPHHGVQHSSERQQQKQQDKLIVSNNSDQQIPPFTSRMWTLHEICA